MSALGRSRPEGCLSDRALDMGIAGELPPERQVALETHLVGCEVCRARQGALLAARAAFPLEAPSFEKLAPAPAPRRHWSWWWALAPLAGAAVLVLLVARPDGQSVQERTKGRDAIGFFVLHDETVREGSDGEVVHPGDRLQLVTTTRAPRYLVVLERDPGGGVSVFFPRGTDAVRRESGRAVPLPYSVELDGTLGVGTIHAVFCDGPTAVAPLRERLQRDGERAAWPPGCRGDRLTYETRRP